MTIVDSENRKTQDIGHCRKCDFQWVIKGDTKGTNKGYHIGKVCPFCRSAAVYYLKEDTR